ncbi:MAG TPA: DNA polymerase IV [Candidatus Taylorbacteria bacterium]|nr:MAG: polymerase IV protein [Parcubacteria group bacterium GW2011_GWA2_47_64]KKU96412.1 MAG: polymerase IV protein [Parcubacteria group bacterium GW2011_GWC2_48_17]HBV01095.1 DNA polymerase IV [Candidatus Taylorbacteria bacterium]
MRIIGHLDMDAFFAAVEERERPYLKGQPIAVGSDPQGGKGRGVVATANYAARAYGIRSATPIQKAWELSEAARKKGLPPVVFITSGFRKYEEVSERIMNIVARHLLPRDVSLFEKEPPALEQVSVDECFFDLSFAGSFEKARKVAENIKKSIEKEERLTCSIGIGPNKLIAKIASDFNKPDGLTLVPAEQISAFLAPLSVRKIPGIGPKAEEKLKRLRVKTIADARKLTEEKLRLMFGKWGSELYKKFRGEDNSPVITDKPPAKSIGEQETLPEDSLDMKVLLPYLERQAQNLASYVIKEGFKSFRTIVLTVRFADFETVSRSRTLPTPASGAETLRRHVTQMFFPFLDRRENPKRKKIRLLGVRVEKLT